MTVTNKWYEMAQLRTWIIWKTRKNMCLVEFRLVRPDSYKPFKWFALFIRLVPSRKIAWLSVIYRDGQNKFSDCTEIIFWYDLSPSTFRIFPSLPQWTLWEMGKGLVRIIKKINPYDTYTIPWAKIFWIQ